MREELPGRPCSVAAALNLIGEKWALLAVREIAFGNKRFDAIARNTGAPRDRLAARLRALESGGVIERRQYSEHPPRYEYDLTEAGLELRGVLTALRVRPRVRPRARPGARLPSLRRGGGPGRPAGPGPGPRLDPPGPAGSRNRPGLRGGPVSLSVRSCRRQRLKWDRRRRRFPERRLGR
jgi:DNA-binding HxlR family transcriptional regulator